MNDGHWHGANQRQLYRQGKTAAELPTSHRAIAKYLEVAAGTGLAEELDVRAAVVINKENIPMAVAVLNNVVRPTPNDDSGYARYADNLPLAGRNASK